MNIENRGFIVALLDAANTASLTISNQRLLELEALYPTMEDLSNLLEVSVDDPTGAITLTINNGVPLERSKN